MANRAGWQARLWPAVAFGLAGVLVPAAWVGPVLARSRNPVSFLLFLGLPGLAAAVAGALLGRPLVAPLRPRSGWWAARRGAVIATVALMLFAPMFATVIKWTEPGWTSVVSLSVLVLWFAFIAVWWGAGCGRGGGGLVTPSPRRPPPAARGRRPIGADQLARRA